MNNRVWSRRLVFGITVVTTFFSALSGWAAPRPNIVFILTDDLGYGDLGVLYQNSRAAAGNRSRPWFATPNLDTFAKEGVQMRRHYCPAPVCAPSRASLLGGVHQGHSGVRDNQFDYPLENNHTLASVLRQAGYATIAIGKYGLDGNATGARVAGPLARGFDEFFGYLDHLDGHYHYPKENGRALYDGTNNISSQLDKCYTTDLWTARAKRWVIDHQATNAPQPFFIYLAYDTPHARLQAPTQPYPTGRGTNGGVRWMGTPGAMINTATGTVDSWIHPDYAEATWADDANPATPEVPWPAFAKRHATIIRRLDDAVADLIQTLKDLGCDNNTLIVFTSDNGPHNEAGTRGTFTQDPRFFGSFAFMDGIKRDCWEAGIRMATLVRWPGGIAPGQTNFTVSAFWDWMPTFAALAGVPAPARTDGVSLVPTLTGTGRQAPSTVYLEYKVPGATPKYAEFEPSHRGRLRNQMQVIAQGDYLGVRYDITGPADDFEIYDVANDPKETTNLAANGGLAPVQQQMKDRVLRLRRPLASAARPYDTALMPPVEAKISPGLNWQVFRGTFPWVPHFAGMTALAKGHCQGLDSQVLARKDEAAVLYTGYLKVPTDGTYTLYLATEGRAFLRLHEASVIDADFGYPGGAERSASVNLRAGCHPLRLAYLSGREVTPSIRLQWSSASISREPVPLTALVREDR